MRYVIAAVACAVLSSCGGSGNNATPSQPGTPAPQPPTGVAAGTMTTNPDGSVSVIVDGQTYTLPASNVTMNGATTWMSGGNRAIALKGGAGTALFGYQGGSAIYAMDGARVAPTTRDTVEATGRVAVYMPNGSSTNQPISMTVNFGTSEVTGTSSGGIGIAGTIDGANIGGDMTYRGSSAQIDGGFYGGNGLAGVANGSNFVGGFAGSY